MYIFKNVNWTRARNRARGRVTDVPLECMTILALFKKKKKNRAFISLNWTLFLNKGAFKFN